MTTTNPRRQCERLWAANKYLVLSHSNKIYLEIRNYLKNDEVSLEQVQAYIDQALDLPENPGQVVNAFQHIWGYFKKKATASEKESKSVTVNSDNQSLTIGDDTKHYKLDGNQLTIEDDDHDPNDTVILTK